MLLIRQRVGLHDGQILFQSCDLFLCAVDCFREKLNQLIFQLIPLSLMVGFQKFQLRHLAVQIGHLNNARVAGSQGLDLGIA